ncbi:MAG: response regulator, partial [Porcipelethomonas sp.]
MYILAVDDEEMVLSDFSHELNKVFPECDIKFEKNPKSALEWAKSLEENGDLLSYAFLDIQMETMDGLELAYQLKVLFPDVVLIFCTAHSKYAYDAFGLFAKGYLLKPVNAEQIQRVLDEMVKDWRQTLSTLNRDIRAQTFGNFEFFVDGKPVIFKREKSKELLAFLIDRHGASVTTQQIANTLWENMTYDQKLKNMTTTVISSLRNTLNDEGIGNLLIKSWNHLAIDISKIKCDAYDFENMDAVAVNSFKGEYMTNYSWAEFTV